MELKHHASRLWPILFLVASLLLLAAVPIVITYDANRVRSTLRRKAAPARTLVTEAHVALALSAAQFRNYLTTEDPEARQLYQSTTAGELRTYVALQPLVHDLGGAVVSDYNALRAASTAWHADVGRLLSYPPGIARAELARHDQLERALVAAAALDRAINEAAAVGDHELARRERTAVLAATLLLLVGLCAIAVTVRVGVRLRAETAKAIAREEELGRVMASKENLMNGLAHDVKNPLGAILGHADVLAAGIKGPLNSGQRESITRIRSLVDNAVGIIDALLNLARLESGEVRFERRTVRLARTIEKIAEEYRGSFEAKQITLRIERPQSDPLVCTDPERVSEIVGNLLSNARKYTPARGVVTVRLHTFEERSQGKSGVAVDVRDTGPGIALERQAQVFDRFTRIDGYPQIPGTGVGLWISRALAKRLGGELVLQSRAGQGSVFSLRLPREC